MSFNFITDNSFAYGFKHESLVETEKLLQKPLSTPQAASYYIGRTFRLAVSIPATLIDIALQIIQCIAFLFESLAIKAEMMLKSCNICETYSIRNTYPLTSLFIGLRKITTINEPWVMAEDFGVNDYFESNLAKKNEGLIFFKFADRIA